METLCARVGDAAVMAVVKSDGYGHGAVTCAREALAAGASWLGTTTAEEALELRAAGLTARILCWLWVPGGPWREAIEADIDVSLGGMWALQEVTEAARAAGRPARVHLKAETGLSRNGVRPGEAWAEFVAAALRAQAEGLVRIVGLYSHFACADVPGHPSIAAQLTLFREMTAYAEEQGVRPEVRHLANSAAALTLPETHLDMVRIGIAMFGVSAGPGLGAPEEYGLRPVMSFRASLALVNQVPEGQGVSYGHYYVTAGETTLGLLPVGYADGVPRAASGSELVLVDGKRCTIAGRVAMDMCVVDLGGDTPPVGSEVVLFGPGDHGESTAADWAAACATIPYEIVTRIGARIPRVYLNPSA
ncbi:alanine racemase [Streptacidiphilus jiangxiensis]|uniref:Alanine racemase n=2 Tax=Streptacidiphilus jiangxiensis TaxID=235985 RepID=A0A1H7KYE7_STRJI|nr:alanine racemase [Streptacidiphilus jiangxiensis]